MAIRVLPTYAIVPEFSAEEQKLLEGEKSNFFLIT
jgi:hypothetical protein